MTRNVFPLPKHLSVKFDGRTVSQWPYHFGKISTGNGDVAFYAHTEKYAWSKPR